MTVLLAVMFLTTLGIAFMVWAICTILSWVTSYPEQTLVETLAEQRKFVKSLMRRIV